MFFGGLWLFPISLAFDDLSSVHWSGEAVFALVYLIVFGSVIAYSCYSYALRKLPMTIVSLYAYINPMIAVALGTVLLNEPLSARVIAAAALVFAGTWIVGRR